jgi:acyl phosphate:glycerol-3-phosphate acyltransferase
MTTPELYTGVWSEVLAVWPVLLIGFAVAYLIGSIPNAYLIVKLVTGEDITKHGSGNVGAMNVRRTTGSWGWFVVAMVADALKGFGPVLVLILLTDQATGYLQLTLPGFGQVAVPSRAVLQPLVIFGAVLGHNYSGWMALFKRELHRTGKGLATGGGALLAYDWRYFVAVVVVGLAVIAITRYMMAGQVAAAWTLPATAFILGSPDWPFMLFMGALVYAAHHKRFVGLLRGQEPKLYIEDRMGPRG